MALGKSRPVSGPQFPTYNIVGRLHSRGALSVLTLCRRLTEALLVSPAELRDPVSNHVCSSGRKTRSSGSGIAEGTPVWFEKTFRSALNTALPHSRQATAYGGMAHTPLPPPRPAPGSQTHNHGGEYVCGRITHRVPPKCGVLGLVLLE